MDRRRLTDRTLKALKPAPTGERIEIMDAVVPGFGVRVTDKGTKTFILIARYPPSRNPARRALGQYGALTLEEGREKARAWLALIDKGIDPKDEEDRQRTQEMQRAENSFAAVAEDFIRLALPKQRKAAVVERELRKEFIARFGARPIDSITPHDIVAVLDEAVARGAPYQAHNLLGHVRRLFNWAIARRIYGIDTSPCDRMRPKDVIGPKKARQRVLTDDELRAYWRASGRLGYPFGPMFRLLALTGCRKAEIAEARWGELHPDLARVLKARKKDDPPINWQHVDDSIKMLTIPPERFKSDAAHLVPLSNEALAVLESVPYFGKGDFLFSTTFGAKPVSGFSKAKARLDREMLRTLKALARMRGEDPGAVTLTPYVNQDVRRTVRTRLSMLRVSQTVAEMVIGHGRKGLERVYDQHEFADEMREALELWAGRLRDVVKPAPANVVDIRHAAG